MMRRAAFTIVELLVVIASVAVLAAILFPVFAQAKLSAKRTSDLSNMKQTGLAHLVYLGDSDDRFIPAGAPAMDYTWSPARDRQRDAGGNLWNGWGLKIARYARNAEVLRSPLLPTKAVFEGECAHANDLELTSTYAVNWLLHRDGSYAADDDPGYDVTPSGVVLDQPIVQTEIVQPSATVSLLPTSVLPPYGAEWGCLYVTLESSDFINRLLITTNYREGANLAFADGHARYIRLPESDAQKHGDTLEIYHLPARGIWIQPTMPDDTLGYANVGY